MESHNSELISDGDEDFFLAAMFLDVESTDNGNERDQVLDPDNGANQKFTKLESEVEIRNKEEMGDEDRVCLPLEYDCKADCELDKHSSAASTAKCQSDGNEQISSSMNSEKVNYDKMGNKKVALLGKKKYGRNIQGKHKSSRSRSTIASLISSFESMREFGFDQNSTKVQNNLSSDSSVKQNSKVKCADVVKQKVSNNKSMPIAIKDECIRGPTKLSHHRTFSDSSKSKKDPSLFGKRSHSMENIINDITPQKEKLPNNPFLFFTETYESDNSCFMPFSLKDSSVTIHKTETLPPINSYSNSEKQIDDKSSKLDSPRVPQRKLTPPISGVKNLLSANSETRTRNKSSTISKPSEVIIEEENPYISPLANPQLQKAFGFSQINRIFPFSLDSKMDELVYQLDLYSKNGIPKPTHLLNFKSQDEDEIKLEDSWRTIVTGNQLLSEREEHRNSAVWELVKTEATYINMLKVITDLFLACLCNLQNEGILNDIDTEKLFNNIQNIYEANLSFWKEHIYVMVAESKKNGSPLNPTLLAEGFYKFGEIFQPYTQYCLEQTNCQLYCKFNGRENNHFRAYLAWCETQKECNRLKLVDILVHPMQRLTRYSILLKAILKKTDIEDHINCIKIMIGNVDRFVSKVNSALRNCHEHERLTQIMKKIDTYDAVEAKDDELATILKQHSELNLLQKMPGCPDYIPRWLLHQADFKFKDAHTSKMDVHVFIFTDCLLITKVTQRKTEKVKVIRPPYHIDKLMLVELKDSLTHGVIHLSDWGVAAAAFTLQSSDAKSHKAMHHSFYSARKQYQEAKICSNLPSNSYDIDDDIPSHNPSRSPRLSSPRTSHMSSLAHSYSGSIDLNESTYTSPGGHHPPSVDLSEIRASSASSEDSMPQVEIQRSKSLEGQHTCPSQRPERRNFFPKSQNTLTVLPHYVTGQSMPNLNAEMSSNSLRVPSPKCLSAGTRGVSYPPPSPRTLKRCPPVPQSRNPPLLKTKRVASVIGPPLDSSCMTENAVDDFDDNSKRRLCRGERLENRRYLTAGAIDDLKKQDSKDSTIHKRLSWNYGQGSTPPPTKECDELISNRPLSKNNKSSFKSVSNDSVHSSSGVSSTSSLRCEYEILENIYDSEEGLSTLVDLPIKESCPKLSPHISTTYICHDSDVTLGNSASQYITQPMEESQVQQKTPVKIGVAENDSVGIASVQITVNDSISQSLPSKASSLVKASSSFSSNSSLASSSSVRSTTSSGGSLRTDNQMKEILLSDTNLETSDV